MKIGILGLGSIGIRHARNLIAFGVEVIGFDPDPSCRESLEEVGGRYTEVRLEVIDECEAIIVASPNECHLADLMDSVAAKCHVFVEKPLAHKIEGLIDIARQAEERGLVIFVGQNLRYHPTVQAARSILNSGDAGKVLWARLLVSSYLPSWRPQQDYRKNYTANPRTGGVLFDDVHEFDLSNYLLGPAVVVASVARRTGTLEIEAEDCADVILRHEGGHCAAIHMDYATKYSQRTTELAMTDGLLRLNILERSLTWYDASGVVVEKQLSGGSIVEDYINEMEHFLRCVGGKSTPRCTLSEAIGILEQVIDARRVAGLPE